MYLGLAGRLRRRFFLRRRGRLLRRLLIGEKFETLIYFLVNHLIRINSHPPTPPSPNPQLRHQQPRRSLPRPSPHRVKRRSKVRRKNPTAIPQRGENPTNTELFAIPTTNARSLQLFAVDLRNLKGLAVFLDAVDPKAEGTTGRRKRRR